MIWDEMKKNIITCQTNLEISSPSWITLHIFELQTIAHCKSRLWVLKLL